MILIGLTGCRESREVSSALQGASYRPQEVVVKLSKSKMQKLGVHKISKTEAEVSFKAKESETIDLQGKYLLLKLNDGESVPQALGRLEGHEDLELVQPNYIYKQHAVPNDPKFGKSWGLKNAGQTVTSEGFGYDSLMATNNPGTSGFDIAVESAWDLITDCSSTTVAVIDSGIDLNHQDFAGNLWANPISGSLGYDAVDQDQMPEGRVNGHGSHVAAVIAARGNNGVGSSGVCQRGKIMPVRVLGEDGSGSTATIVTGISYARAYGARIANLSLGGSVPDLAFLGAMGDASEMLFVVSAGNDNANVEDTMTKSYPCNYSSLIPNVICVASVDQAFSPSSFSNYGTVSVQISAPGTNILGAWPTVRAVTTENFAGWTTNDSRWTTGAGPALVNPTNYNGTSNTYANSIQSAVYKNYNFQNANRVQLELDVVRFLETNADYYYIGFDRVPLSNIFAAPSSYSSIYSLTGDGTISVRGTLGTALDFSDSCGNQSNCTIGFQLRTDATVPDFGVRVSYMSILADNASDTSYAVINGTSMATPYVSGVAALVWSYNPRYTVADVKQAILQGGRPRSNLVSRTSTGKVLSAMGALATLTTPSVPVVETK